MKIQKELALLTLAAFSVVVSAQTTVTTAGGTTNTIPVFTGTSVVGNSVITQSGGNVGIGTTSPANVLDVNKGSITGGGGIQIDGTNDTRVRIGQGMPTVWSWSNGWTTPGDFSLIQEGVSGSVIYVKPGGNVGIGTTSPSQLLEVNGNAQVDGSLQLGSSGIQVTSGGIVFPNGGGTQTAAWTGVICGGDFAESVDVSGDRAHYEPGDVLVVDSEHPGEVAKSAEAYSSAVVGVYSTRPGVVGRRQKAVRSADEVPMAMVGIVPIKANAENGPIRPGDLLVTSSIPGYAMKGTDRSRMLGAVIGKSFGNLGSGTGVIEVGVSLQ
jgi:hypothetical protein